MSQKDADKVVTVIAYLGQSDKSKEISYTDMKVIGSGSFGIVFQARLCDTNDIVAVKKVLQDRRFKNRELQIMRQLEHPNIVLLKYFFHSVGERKEDVFLNLVLEYIPETVYRVARRYTRQKETVPILFVKLYMYQLMRSLAYIHHKGICHRDIKPQNLLLNPSTGVLKLCDFGSAKALIRGEPNVSYICSRYYRAPELIFGAVEYSCQIDVWSSGCVLAELLLGQPIFPGDSGVDQLVEIIKVLGTPTKDQIHEMNPDYREFRFPQIKPHLWCKVFCPRVPADAVNLVSQLLDYTPSKRLKPLETCLHSFFNDLREENARLPNDQPLPPLFNLTAYELSSIENIQKLLPSKAKPATDSPQATPCDSYQSGSPLFAGDGGPATAHHSSDVIKPITPLSDDSNLNPVSTVTPQHPGSISGGSVGGPPATCDVLNKNNNADHKIQSSDGTSECRTNQSADGSSPKE